MSQCSSYYKNKYNRLLNVKNPKNDQFSTGKQFEYFIFPKSIKGSENTRVERKSSKEHFIEAVLFAIKNRLFITNYNIEMYLGKTCFAPTLFLAVQSKLPKKRKKDLVLFCAYGTAFDLWNRGDLFFVLGRSVVKIDLTLNHFRDKPKNYSAVTYVFTRYNLVGSGLAQISEKIANSLNEGDYKIPEDISGKVKFLLGRCKDNTERQSVDKLKKQNTLVQRLEIRNKERLAKIKCVISI